MTEEMQAQEQAEQVEESPDWQAKYEAMREHMREWEKKAKANQTAADELEQLKAAQMTEQEKVIARAEAAENELEALKAEKAKNDAARELSDKTGVPFDMLMFCSDVDAMEEFAKTYAKQAHVSSAPKANSGTRIIKGNEKPSSAAMFAEVAEQLFK